MIREISSNYQIIYLHGESFGDLYAYDLARKQLWRQTYCQTMNLCQYFRETQSLAPESNFQQLPEWVDREPLAVPK